MGIASHQTTSAMPWPWFTSLSVQQFPSQKRLESRLNNSDSTVVNISISSDNMHNNRKEQTQR